ncbi:ATP-dependent DNA helicase yku80 [Neophaeococcomyces mojaviensis]|uniref:ATP-dependent DNA helicase yku80 n=1 Tax=Neophaeococcomyces mojaviensis TaxID=3383035 RepID=A0ACC3ABW7_9EURO|nr:ATP-dependent DNA helicase yku80 [Knufia sp. JES_112]
MADKECNVFIIDLGRSMGQKRHDREQSDLDYSLQYVWDKVTNYVYLGRKGLVTGVIGLRTDKTKNHMQEEGGYENITLIQSIQNITMPELRRLPGQLHANTTDSGDALSAVILAVDMIMKHCRDLKFAKRIYLITNGTGPLDADDIEQTAAQIKQNNIQLTVLGVDFDDPEYGFKEENKPFQKQENEKALKKLVELSDGVYGTMQEAIEGIARPHIKTTRSVPTYKGQLRLGDPSTYDTAITIDIERYFKVSVAKPKTASSFIVKDGAPSQAADGDNLAVVRNAYSYSVKDESAPAGKRDVPREELAKGYSYGRTAVHIAESEQNITRLETEQNYEIIGFIPQENIERYMFLDSTNMIVAQKVNDKAAYALSSLIHALFECGSVAIARLVKKDLADPQLTVLSPYITEDIECLIENGLPFAEDLRVYRFPPLDKIITVSGRTLTSHRNLPSDNLLSAMSDYVDSMSLISKDVTPPAERFAIEDLFSPLLHTIEGAIKYRAVHPSEPLPPKSDILLEPSHQPSDLVDNAKAALDHLIKVSDVKKVPPKKKGRFRTREIEKPLSGLDVDALLKKGTQNGTSKNFTIDPTNALPEFRRVMDQPDDEERVKSAVKQMGKIIEDLIAKSFGEQNYAQALEMLGVVRSEMVDYEWSEYYNELVKGLKSKLLKEELGGDRREFWYELRKHKLGLIDDSQAESSNVSKDEASQFLMSKV